MYKINFNRTCTFGTKFGLKYESILQTDTSDFGVTMMSDFKALLEQSSSYSS